MPPSPESPGVELSDAAATDGKRWPRVVGTIGIVAAVVMFLDKLDDLLMLPWMRSRDWWVGLVGDEVAGLVMRWMPPPGWIVSASLVGMALGTLLFVGAWRLRRGRRSAVALCRAWSWLAIVWLLVEVGGSLWWLSAHGDELQTLAPGDWQGQAIFAIVSVVLVLAALPVFLLSWFARPEIKAQLAGWPE